MCIRQKLKTAVSITPHPKTPPDPTKTPLPKMY